MAWNKEITKEDFVKVGLDPDNINAKLGSAVTQEQLEAVKTSIMDGFKTSFQELEGKLTARPNTENNENNEEDGNNGEKKPNGVDPIEFMSDPTKHTQDMINKTAGTLQLQNIKLYSQMAYDNARRDGSKFPLFDRYKTEIDAEWDKIGLQFKSQPGTLIENIYKIVVANHIDELMTESAKNNGRFNVVAAGGNSNSNSNVKPPDKTPEELLTPEELKVAANFGMTPKEYAAQKGEMRYA